MVVTTTTEENKALVRQFIDDVVNGDDLDVIDELFAEDVVNRTALGVTEGRDSLKDLLESLQAGFSHHEQTIDAIVAEDDLVAIRGPSELTHDGEFMGIPATGKTFEIDGASFFRIADGKIVERWTQFDMLTFMSGIGAVDLPEGLGDG